MTEHVDLTWMQRDMVAALGGKIVQVYIDDTVYALDKDGQEMPVNQWGVGVEATHRLIEDVLEALPTGLTPIPNRYSFHGKPYMHRIDWDNDYRHVTSQMFRNREDWSKQALYVCWLACIEAGIIPRRGYKSI